MSEKTLYEVEIEEVTHKFDMVKVMASSEDEAEEKAKKMYDDDELCLEVTDEGGIFTRANEVVERT